ncbi:hypothetical protein [Geminicoccus harenae]|uniref:hypothetical protein n=1 Tax=Geminicoccus harenae TaxID=2498453 RepID=UPI00168BD3F7|nr:hypothetical protein [Geminicoccus harenae]
MTEPTKIAPESDSTENRNSSQGAVQDADRRAAIQRLVALASAMPMVALLANPKSAKAQVGDSGFFED